MGEEDEGFDEEFCDIEDQPLRPAPHELPPLNLQDLNTADIQSLLVDNSLTVAPSDRDSVVPPPFPALLDDIDPGVFVAEMDHSTHPLLGGDAVIEKSPIHSPFPLSPSHSPVCSHLNSMTLGGDTHGCAPSLDDWSNSTHPMFDYPTFSEVASSVGDSEYGSSVNVCSQSQYLFPGTSLPSPSPPPHSAQGCYGLDMLVPVSSQANTFTSHQSPPSHHTYQQSQFDGIQNFGTSPVHSLPPPTPPPSHHIVTSPATNYHQPSHNYEGNPLISGQFTQMHGGATSPIPSPHGMATGNFASCSTQTPLARTPSPAPSQNHTPITGTTTHGGATPTNSDSETPKRKPGSEHLVNMPFYKFKRLLDSPNVPEEKKTDIKVVRRRGKNKLAAKVCRHRKQELVLGLQQEIDSLRSRHKDTLVRKESLEREVDQWKTHCLALFRRNNQQPLPH